MLRSWCQRLGCAGRWRVRTRRIVLWYGKLDRTPAGRKVRMTLDNEGKILKERSMREFLLAQTDFTYDQILFAWVDKKV